MLSLLENITFQDIGVTRGNDSITSLIQKRDGNQLKRAGEFIGANQRFEHRFQPILKQGLSEFLSANGGAQEVRINSRPIAQVGFRGIPNPGMLLNLPAHYEQPNDDQEAVNGCAA